MSSSNSVSSSSSQSSSEEESVRRDTFKVPSIFKERPPRPLVVLSDVFAQKASAVSKGDPAKAAPALKCKVPVKCSAPSKGNATRVAPDPACEVNASALSKGKPAPVAPVPAREVNSTSPSQGKSASEASVHLVEPSVSSNKEPAKAASSQLDGGKEDRQRLLTKGQGDRAKSPGARSRPEWPEDWSDLSSEHSDYQPNERDRHSSSESLEIPGTKSKPKKIQKKKSAPPRIVSAKVPSVNEKLKAKIIATVSIFKLSLTIPDCEKLRLSMKTFLSATKSTRRSRT